MPETYKIRKVNPRTFFAGRRRLVELYFVIVIVLVALMLFGYTHFLIEQLRSEYRKTTLAYTTYQTLVVSDLTDPAMENVKVDLTRRGRRWPGGRVTTNTWVRARTRTLRRSKSSPPTWTG
jgi:hypothetical protein